MNEPFARGLPKAEIHLHIEGTLEPEMMVALAERNGVSLSFDSVEEARAAYEFDDLQAFLDIYYTGAEVLQTEGDFAELMTAYLERAYADGVRHAEMFFDPQTHTGRGVQFPTFMAGFATARADAAERLGMSTELIMCFLRHLDASDAMATLDAAMPYRDAIIGVGLDSSEIGNPPEKFEEVFARARAEGLRITAHAGEEAGPDFIMGALEALGAERIDHGVRSEDDPGLVARLASDGIALTMCPLSNVKLRVFDKLTDHNLKRLLEAGVRVTINSDDPAYFGGYIGDNYLATAEALDLGEEHLIQIARNSIEASFASDERRAELIDELNRFVAEN
ncbi:MAG: adenosine deaminase [Acidimicrobiia bacterium]|nr:adenosine deaminase [Acidimicrobiia bacterium]